MKKANSKERRNARVWLVYNGIKQVELQKELGMKSSTQIRETLTGDRSDRRVLLLLLKKGCPVKHLNLPADMREVV